MFFCFAQKEAILISLSILRPKFVGPNENSQTEKRQRNTKHNDESVSMQEEDIQTDSDDHEIRQKEDEKENSEEEEDDDC